MSKLNWEELTARFIKVRDTLANTKHQYAYRMAYKQAWKFYREHTPDEAIKILVERYR